MRPFVDSRQTLPVLLGGVAGALVFWGLYQPNPVSDGLLQVAQIVTAAGVLLGIGNLLLIHLRRLVRRGPGRLNSLVLILALVGSFGLQLTGDLVGGIFATLAKAMFRYAYQPLAASFLALLTFFALRAAWRAVQFRPREGWIVVSVGAVFLLASGPWAALVPGLQPVLDWIRAYPALGVARGLLLGVAIGAMVASVRLLLGFDRPYVDR